MAINSRVFAMFVNCAKVKPVGDIILKSFLHKPMTDDGLFLFLEKETAQFRELIPVIFVTNSDVSEEKRPSAPNSKAR